MRIRPASFAFTLLLGALGALPSLSIDMGLPALSHVARSLGTTSAGASLSLSVFMVGFALAPLVFGPLSDRHGRRPVLLAGCAIFTLAGVGCALAGSLPVLLGCRFVQGAGAGSGAVLVLATIRDLFEGPVARARQSYVSMVMSVAPMVAPTLGAWVLAVGHWRAIYGVLALGGLVLLGVLALGLPESAPAGRVPLTARGLGRAYARVLGHRLSFGYSLINALSFGACFAYISGSPLVLMEVLGVSPKLYGTCFALTSLALMVGAFINGRLSARGVSGARLLTSGLALAGGCAVLLVGLTLTGLGSLATMLPLFVLGNLGMALISPNATHGALQPMPDIAGVASAVLSGLRMLMAAGTSALVAFLYDGRSALAVTGVMTAFALASALVYVTFVRPVESRAVPGPLPANA